LTMSSAFKKTNPILQCYSEEPESHKPMKVQVPSYMSSQQWLINRPRGIARAHYSNYKDSQVHFEPTEPAPYKPSKKFIHQKTEEPEVKTTRVRREQERNPINQDDETFTPKPVKQRPQRVYESQITLDDNFSEPPIQSARADILSRKNSSQVFETDGQADPIGKHKRRVSHTKEEVDSVMQYKYALPYRTDRVSEKPSEGRASAKRNTDLPQFKSAAVAMKNRMLSSNITFS